LDADAEDASEDELLPPERTPMDPGSPDGLPGEEEPEKSVVSTIDCVSEFAGVSQEPTIRTESRKVDSNNRRILIVLFNIRTVESIGKVSDRGNLGKKRRSARC
jgi:hypothetical protein